MDKSIKSRENICQFPPVQCVLTSSVETELCSTQSSPCDTVSGVVQAAKRTLKETEGLHLCVVYKSMCANMQFDIKLKTSLESIKLASINNISRFTPLTPRPETLGSRFSSGTSTSSIRIIPVAEALRENFPSILGVARPFMPRSKMKPRTFPSSHLAQTTAMSATGELVILKVEEKRETSLYELQDSFC